MNHILPTHRIHSTQAGTGGQVYIHPNKVRSISIANLLALILLLLGALSGSVHAATFAYSTYFGASQYEGAYALAVDEVGNAYVAGGTSSTNDFPVLNALQPSYGGSFTDGFVAKFSPDGKLLFSTYFGGSGPDFVNALALDREGNLIVAGETHSVDLPTTDDAFQPEYAGGSAFGYGDGFIARLTPDGSKLLYCSYFGGNGDDKINAIAIDKEGNPCVTGTTDSKDLPLKNALQPQPGGGETEGFIAKFDTTLTHLIFSTYLGGEDKDEDQRIAVDPSGLIYVSGQTLSTNFPVTVGAFQTKHIQIPEQPENWDAVITKLKPDGSALVYSTYVGDATGDAAFAVAAGADGSAYITGVISAGWDPGAFPLGFQPEPGYGGADAWVAKLKPDGSNFEWFSYLGGSGEDIGFDLALDGEDNVYVTGITFSSDFPTRDAVQSKYGGGQDAFVAKISADGNHLIYSTFLGGSREEWGNRIAVDPQGNVFAVGQTEAVSFPIFNAIQSTNASVRTSLDRPADAYITKITPTIQQPPLKIARSGMNTVITWPTNFTGFVLESTAALGSEANWKPVTATPTVLGSQFALIQRANEAAQFHRLHRP
jgi:hypothetical protein